MRGGNQAHSGPQGGNRRHSEVPTSALELRAPDEGGNQRHSGVPTSALELRALADWGREHTARSTCSAPVRLSRSTSRSTCAATAPSRASTAPSRACIAPYWALVSLRPWRAHSVRASSGVWKPQSHGRKPLPRGSSSVVHAERSECSVQQGAASPARAERPSV